MREVSEPAEVLALQRELEPDTHIFAYRLDGAEVTASERVPRGPQEKKEKQPAGEAARSPSRSGRKPAAGGAAEQGGLRQHVPEAAKTVASSR